MKYRNHHRPDTAHDCSLKLAKQEQNARDGIFIGVADPDSELGFSFVPMHPDWHPPHASGDADVLPPES